MNVNSYCYRHKITKQFLINNGFRYSRGWSDEEGEAYVSYQPIYQYHGLATLELRIVLYDDGDTRIDVLDCSTHGVYAPWYRNESCDKYPIIKEVDNNIKNIMKHLGFAERGKDESIKNRVRRKTERKVKDIVRTGVQ